MERGRTNTDRALRGQVDLDVATPLARLSFPERANNRTRTVLTAAEDVVKREARRIAADVHSKALALIRQFETSDALYDELVQPLLHVLPWRPDTTCPPPRPSRASTSSRCRSAHADPGL